MSTKHTSKASPGPWLIDTFRNASGMYTHTLRANGNRIHREATYDVEPSADARLIAAAPELLEALQLAYQLIPRPTLDTLGAAEACANLAWIKRILDKAEGSDK